MLESAKDANGVRLAGAGPRAAVERIAPEDINALRIGHFGFFREQFRQTLWPRAVADLVGLAGLPVTGTTV